MSEWRDVTLGDVLTLQRGFDITKKMQRPGAVPVISSSGIGSYHDEARADGPGVVIGRKGSLGTVFFVEEPYWPHDTTLWVKDFKDNDPYFCHLLFKTLPLAELDAGSSNPTLNRNHAHKLPVRIPGLPLQRRISAVLAAFDELIAINECRIELVEGLTRSFYREWFVRFRFPGPGGLPPKGGCGCNAPPGWREMPLGELAEVVSDGILPADVPPAARYCGLEHLPRRATTLREWSTADTVTSRKLRFQEGDTLFGKIRPYFHKVVWAPFAGIASSDAIVFRALQDRPLPALINAILSSDPVVAKAVATSNGTKMPRVDPRALLDYPVVLPAREEGLVSQAETALRATYDHCAALARQNLILAETRDLLLPRLVTARLDISDVDLGDLLADEDAE